MNKLYAKGKEQREREAAAANVSDYGDIAAAVGGGVSRNTAGSNQQSNISKKAAANVDFKIAPEGLD